MNKKCYLQFAATTISNIPSSGSTTTFQRGIINHQPSGLPQQPPGVRAATLHLQRIRRIPAHKLLAQHPPENLRYLLGH
jgi:hypothetical protein